MPRAGGSSTESGEPVLLRGVNLGGWLVKEGYILHFPGEALDAPSEIDRAIVDLAGPVEGPRLLEEWRAQWMTQADLAEIHALGFNSVRLPLHYDLLWDLARAAPRPEGFAFLDEVVGWCERQRLWLFLDLHCAPGGQNAGNISDSDGVARLYGDPASQEATIGLWQAIAARYRDRGAVIGGYDLLNEPVYQPGVLVARFLERLARAVRAADGRHLIVLEGNTWASDFSIFGAPFDSEPRLQLPQVLERERRGLDRAVRRLLGSATASRCGSGRRARTATSGTATRSRSSAATRSAGASGRGRRSGPTTTR